MSHDKSKDKPLAPPSKQPDIEIPKPEKKTRWAIVGLGKLAVEEILPAITQTKRCEVTALVSDHKDKAKQLAKKYEIKSDRIYDYENFDSIKDADNVDIVYIVLPNSLHRDFTLRAFKAGKHVICEKPMADTVKECEEMISAAKNFNKKLMIAYRLHYEPNTKKAFKIMRSGELGKIRTFEAMHANHTKAPNIRLSKKLGGGPMEDMGIYCLNAARNIVGEEPIGISALGVSPEDEEGTFREVYGHSTFQLKFPSGALAICGCGFDSVKSDRFRVTCEKGYLEMKPAFGYHSLRLKHFIKAENKESRFKIPPKNHFAAEMDHFSKCVRDGKEVRTTGEEGLKDMIVIEKYRESCEKDGMMVKIPQWIPERSAHV